MKFLITFTLVFCFGFFANCDDLTSYLTAKTRLTKLVRETTEKDRDSADRKALAQLEPLLKKLIGKVNVDGFSGDGKINLETLQSDEIGSNMLDALRFTNKDETLVVTNAQLIENYLRNQKSREISSSSLFDSDGSYTPFVRFPEKEKGTSAALSLVAQDIGAFPPNVILASHEDSSRGISFFFQKRGINAPQIPKCEKLWKQELKPNDPESEKSAFQDYKKCWENEAQKQEFFSKLQTQAHRIVQSISHADGQSAKPRD